MAAQIPSRLGLRISLIELRTDVVPPAVLQRRILFPHRQRIVGVADIHPVHQVRRGQCHVGVQSEIAVVVVTVEDEREVGLQAERAAHQRGVHGGAAVAHVVLRLHDRQMKVEPGHPLFRLKGIEIAKSQLMVPRQVPTVVTVLRVQGRQQMVAVGGQFAQGMAFAHVPSGQTLQTITRGMVARERLAIVIIGNEMPVVQKVERIFHVRTEGILPLAGILIPVAAVRRPAGSGIIQTVMLESLVAPLSVGGREPHLQVIAPRQLRVERRVMRHPVVPRLALRTGEGTVQHAPRPVPSSGRTKERIDHHVDAAHRRRVGIHRSLQRLSPRIGAAVIGPFGQGQERVPRLPFQHVPRVEVRHIGIRVRPGTPELASSRQIGFPCRPLPHVLPAPSGIRRQRVFQPPSLVGEEELPSGRLRHELAVLQALLGPFPILSRPAVH